MEQLHVYLRGERVGTLMSDKGRLFFEYEPAYLQSPGATALAYTMPLREQPYAGGEVVSFFSNLLPDESVRVKLSQYLGISHSNVFALLKRIGEDCAGAVAVIAPEREMQAHAEAEYRSLAEDEAHEVLLALPERPLNVGARDFHISGAGAQDKLVACVQDGQIVLPLNGTPSTHIIKPGIDRFPESVFNEYYCMRLAERCGLDVAACKVLRIKDVPYYVTTRYDRVIESGKWVRLHQEDFCQLLGYEPGVKYESEGGPRLLQCFQLLREMELPAVDLIEFLRRIIFIFLIGNGDAHAKNFSVIYREGVARLAPAYDLLSTVVYPNLPAKLAMKIEGRSHFDWISRAKFLRMGSKAGLSERLVHTEIDKMLKRLNKELDSFTQTVSAEAPSQVYAEIQSGIRRRMQQLERV